MRHLGTGTPRSLGGGGWTGPREGAARLPGSCGMGPALLGPQVGMGSGAPDLGGARGVLTHGFPGKGLGMPGFRRKTSWAKRCWEPGLSSQDVMPDNP